MQIINPFKGYKVEVGKRAQKTLDKFDTKIQTKILDCLQSLTKDANSLDIKKLQGYENVYRISVGSYRIVFEPHNKIITIYVIFVGTRENFYKDFKLFYG